MSFLQRPRNARWRRTIFQIHLWAGILLALYVIAVSLSGSLLVFERELTDDAPRLAPDELPAHLDCDGLSAAAQARFPGGRLVSIDLRDQRRAVPVTVASAQGSHTVYLDALTQGDAGEARPHPLMDFTLRLHTELLSARRGALVNGIGGLSLLLMAASGIVLWWPGVHRWRRATRVDWRARWPRLHWELHSALGFWTLAVVSMWGATGAYFIWPQPVRNVAAKVAAMPHFTEGSSAWRPGDPVLPFGRLVDSALERHPGAKLAYLFADTGRVGGVVKVFLSTDPAQSLTLREDVFTFQPATGELLGRVNTDELTPAERLSLALYSIHFGDFAGLWGKLLWCVLGLSPTLLAVTGYAMWWNRVAGKRWRRWCKPTLSWHRRLA